jgi:alpha-galactosidase
LVTFANNDEPMSRDRIHRSSEYGVTIANSIVTGRSSVVYGNLVNNGAIPNLPATAIVETPTLVDANGCQPTVVSDIPPQLVALMRTQINVQELVVRALIDEDVRHIYHAAYLDPHTAAELDLRQIRSLVTDLLVAHGDWVPEWARVRRAA